MPEHRARPGPQPRHTTHPAIRAAAAIIFLAMAACTSTTTTSTLGAAAGRGQHRPRPAVGRRVLFDARRSESSFLRGNWPERPAAGVGELAGYVEPCYSGERVIWSRLAKKSSSSLAACCRSVSSWPPNR